MEEQLRARKLASASVRRRRMDERQKQKELLAEQREEWRKRRARYSEIYTIDSDVSRSHSPENENDSSFESPSEDSVPTPVSPVSPDVEFNISISDLTLERFTKRATHTESMVKNKTLAVADWTLNTDFSSLARPKASLDRPTDFRYDRFSTAIDTIDIPPHDGQISSESEDNGEEDDESDDDYEYSPIEVATPIAICMPTTKPSVISVADLRSRRFSVKTVDAIMINPPSRATLPTPAPRQALKLQGCESSGFPVHEAEPLEAVKASSTSFVSTAPSSEDNFSIFDDATSHINMKRKSSMPMFAKFTHARMNSIKKLIKPQSFSGPLPAVPQIPSNHQSQTSDHVNSVRASTPTPSPIYLNKISGEYESFDRVPRRSTTEPLTQPRHLSTNTNHRPQTPYRSHSNLARLSCDITALPVLPISQDIPQIKRKKSFSNLRRRSGSLGQALKLANSKNSKSPLLDTAPPPPVPSIKTGDYATTTLDLGPGPARPLRSLRSSGLLMRSSVSSSASSHFDTHASVGLGLRM